MHPIPTPPQTIDEIPEKCIAAWQALGAELDDKALANMRNTWTSGNLGVFAHALCDLCKTVPVEQLPGWREALLELLQRHPEAYEAHGAFLVDACIHLLDAGDVLSIPGNAALISDKHWPQAWLRNYAPRSRNECESLARLIRTTPDPDTQASAFDLLARSHKRGKETSEQRATREALLLDVMPHIRDGTLRRFQENNSSMGGLCAQSLALAIENPRLLLALAEGDGLGLRRRALSQLAHASVDASQLGPDFTGRVKKLLSADPVSFRKAHYVQPILELIEHAWSEADGEKMRLHVLGWITHLLASAPLGEPGPEHPVLPLLQRIFDEAPAQARHWFWNPENYDPYADLRLETLEQLWRLQPSALLDLFPTWLAGRLGVEDDWPIEWPDEERGEPHVAAKRLRLSGLLESVLSARAADLESVKPGDVVHLLPHVKTPELLARLSPPLQALGAKSKPLQRALPEHLARFGANDIERLGWLADKRKGVRDIGLEALLLCHGSEAEALLLQVHADARTADTDRDRIDARLGVQARRNAAPAASSPTVEPKAAPPAAAAQAAVADLDALKARVAKAKIKPAVDKVWSDALATALAPLPPEYARWLLSLAAETKEDRLTDTALGLLAHLSRERQAAFAEHALKLWLANNGDRKLIWLLLFVPVCGDDRLPDHLAEAFKGWHKRAKPKAVTALQTMAALDTAYALSHVYEVYSKATYSYAIHEGAKAALEAAAQRRGCSLADLFDEITPDFGLTGSARTFDLGPYGYTMQVGTDLELRFTHSATGKASKTLPKARDGEDADARAAAEATIKLLRGGLKKVVKLQAQRLEDAMVCQRAWPAARWRVLFVDHAVLGLIGQGLLWTRLGADGSALGSFRIGEDRALIDAADQTVQLGEDERVRLWHPALAAEGEAAAWTAHLADYEIKPFLDQLGRPVVVLDEAERTAPAFHRHTGLSVAQATLKYGLEGWNYQISDQDGSHIAGFERCIGEELWIRVDTEDMDAALYGDATVGAVKFFRNRKALSLGEVPPPLLSLAAEHLGKLAQKARA